MQSSVAELAENMKELDLKSAELYEKLSNLEKELQMETEIYDEVKQMELSELLNDQNRLQQELSVSQQSMKENAFKLEEIMGKFEREADVLTALALFPLKSQDKKIAFIVGLALVFKIPYDMSMMFAVRGIEGNEIFSLLTQTLLAFTCFFHYGLIQAIGRKSTSVESTNLPPL